jgi:hypothetical protein
LATAKSLEPTAAAAASQCNPDGKAGGSIVVEVKVGAVHPLGHDRLTLSYGYPRGASVWVLDEATLRPIPGATAPREEPLLPPAFAKLIVVGC